MGAQNNNSNIGNLPTKTTPTTSDYVVLVNSATSDTLNIATIGSLPATGIMSNIYPNLVSGTYQVIGNYPRIFVGNAPKNAGGSNVGYLYYFPFIVAVSTTFTAINAYVMTAFSSANFVLGLYGSNAGNNAPTGNPITNSNSGSISMSTTGLKTYSFSSAITLTPGVYWGATSGNSTSGAFLGVSYNYNIALGQTSPTATSSGTYLQAFTYSATLPTVGTLTPQPADAEYTPLIWLTGQ